MMNRKELEEYIQNNYSAEPDYPWIQYPNYVVFRHQNNKKWFALIMDVPKNKLGLQEDDKIKMLLDMSFEMTEPKIHRKKM